MDVGMISGTRWEPPGPGARRPLLVMLGTAGPPGVRWSGAQRSTHPEVTTTPDRRVRVLVQGIVQGVGFRPFVYNLATGLGLRGFVRNDPAGVTVEVQGEPRQVDAFLLTLVASPPPLARIESVAREELGVHDQADGAAGGGPGFVILASVASGSAARLVCTATACPLSSIQRRRWPGSGSR
ncbi:MAG: hypothetical protein NVS1B16_13220 [Pseudarthrobacter sp.]